MKKHYKNNSAFTLVEMSIVLVIVGLLIGATLAGKALMGSSETKSMLSEVQKLNTAIANFRSNYKGLPGDIPNAATFLNGATNGNGNGKIDSELSTSPNEPFMAMQDLALANLLEGSYAGFSGAYTGSAFALSSPTVTGNVMGSKGRNGGALYVKCCSGAVDFATDPNYDYNRTLTFKNYVNLFSVLSGDAAHKGGILTPIEAYDIDLKIDDGIPDTGLIGGSGGWTGAAYAATGCYSGTGSTSTYDSAVAANKNQQGCQMQFAYDWE